MQTSEITDDAPLQMGASSANDERLFGYKGYGINPVLKTSFLRLLICPLNYARIWKPC